MKPETLLDSAVFQLTPTRTRCDLIIIVNGKSEKLASGLLNPFLAHLKAARDQISKGGYSIPLEPDHRSDAVWFTKGTVERFVRFVSTPEILERVGTIESEILQIEEAITIQGNDNLGISTVGDHPTRSSGSAEGLGSKPMSDADAEKAIVLYKPGSQPPDSNGSIIQEENSKVQLLRVLESRKTVLQKEQGMAFARATAAGFDMDSMAHLISFAETFGASRLKDACLRFMELWRRKHETGQWLEIEAAEAMSARHDFSAFNASGIILSGDSIKQTDYIDAWPGNGSDLGAENNGKAGHINGDLDSDQNKDRRLPLDPQVPLGPHEYFQGQFHHPAFPQWPVHSGPPVYPPYPMQGMPYYQNYPGGGPYFQAPYPPTEDPRFNTPQRNSKRHSMDSKDSMVDSEGALSTRSQDALDQNMSEFEKEDPQGHESHKKGRSGKKKSGVVVIRNINYITSKRREKSGSESSSTSESETAEETEDSDTPRRKNKKSSRSSKKKGGHIKYSETSNAYERDEIVKGQKADSGNWQVFQSFLLRNKDENTRTVNDDLFADEKEPPVKRKQHSNGADPILSLERNSGDAQEGRIVGFDSANGNGRRMKQMASNDELLISTEGSRLRDSQIVEQFNEIEGGGRMYHKGINDDFMIYGHEKHLGSRSSLDPIAGNEYELAGKLDKGSSHGVTDDSFVVSLRSGSHDQLGAESRTVIDMDSELPSSFQRTEDSSSRSGKQISYEPDDLSMMPERELERESIGYDPTIDYDLQIPVVDAVKQEATNQEDTLTSTQEGLEKSDTAKKLKASQNGSEKRRMDVPTRSGRSLKSNPLTEAQKRADQVRMYKADLQKAKKEKEEEERRRLEALKREREKRIAARSSSNATQSPTPKQTVARLPTKPSPSSFRWSKFTDPEPGSSSPLQKLPMKTTSTGSNESPKTIKTSRLSGKTPMAENGLSRSVSSLPDLKKESDGLTPKARASSIRRLSEPKNSNIHRASSLKSSHDQVSKKKAADDPQKKKISAIMHLDKTKSETLPELKIRPSGGASDASQKKSTSKEALQKGSGSGTALTLESIQGKKTHETSRLDCSEENLVIEKNIMILENEKAPANVVQASEEMVDTSDKLYMDSTREKTEFISDCAAIPAPPSSVNEGELEDPNEHKVDDQLNSYEVVEYSRDESEKFSSSTLTEKPYQAPYAQATSLEDSTTRNLEYTEAPAVITSQMVAKDAEIGKAYVSDFVDLSSGDHMHEKSRSRESSKGFRKLLKFGRKGHSSALSEHSIDSEGSTVNDHSVASSSNDIHIVKNFIPQDTQIGGIPPKASRTFSLLSPFRSKTSDKKLAA